MNEKKKSKKRNGRFKSILSGILIVLFGFIVLNYPNISDAWNTMLSERLVTVYQDESGKMNPDILEQEMERAREYNRRKTVNSPVDPFSSAVPMEQEYTSCLNISGNGIMGYLELPKIHQRIVLYHGISEEVLQKGCGHVEGTSLPVGGKGTHAVIAGHRGVPAAKLFTDLDQIQEGDQFYLFILDQTLAYEVDQIKVVLPDNVDDLQIEEEKDLVTLVTCTPYGVNTHRLLVRGHRVAYEPEEETITVADTVRTWEIRMTVAVATLLAVLLVRRYILRRKRKKISPEEKHASVK